MTWNQQKLARTPSSGSKLRGLIEDGYRVSDSKRCTYILLQDHWSRNIVEKQ